MRSWLTEVALSTIKYLPVVAGGAAVGALVGGLIWGAWFLGALGVGCVVALIALPSGVMESNWNPSRPFNDPTP